MWLIGVVNTKHDICGDPGPCHQFEAKPSQFFTTFDSLVVLTTCSDAYISRSGDFGADNNDDRWINRLLYPLCMHVGVTIKGIHKVIVLSVYKEQYIIDVNLNC